LALLALSLGFGGRSARQRGQCSSAAAATADAQNVELVAQLGGESNAVVVQGNHAYVSIGPRLVVLDISNPALPTPIGQTEVLPDRVTDVALVGSYAYATDYSSRLWVIDISDPTNPIKMESVHTPGIGKDVAVEGGFAYIACDGGEVSLQVVDVSDPTSPTEVGFVEKQETGGNIEAVAIADDYAYVFDSLTAGLQVVDVSNPTNPTEVGYYQGLGGGFDVTVVGNYAYVASANSLEVLDISIPTNPTKVGVVYMSGQDFFGVVVAGNYAYAVGSGGLRIVDVSSPANPTEVGAYDTPDVARGVAVADSYAYVATGNHGGLRVMDISNPPAPTQVGFYDTLGNAEGVAVADGYAYVVGWGSGLQVVDISNPASPSQIGAYYIPGTLLDVAVASDHAYIVDRFDGLRIVDVSNPTTPFETGFYNTPGHALNVAIAGNYAYLADLYYGLRIIDISSPVNPTERGVYYANATGVAVSGTYAYITNGYGLEVIDVSDPLNPTKVGVCDRWVYANNVTVARGYAYIADCWSGLRVVDISDPTDPIEVGFYETSGNPLDVTVVGRYVYVAEGPTFHSGQYVSGGLRVVDISDPANPIEIGFYNTGAASDVAVTRGYAHVADRGGLFILRYYSGTISGRVIDSNATPVSGVTVSAVSGLSTTTGADGYYTISDLSPGIYTLTPTLPGFAFWPPTRTVTLPPDTTNQDFIILAEPVSTTLTPGIASALVYTDVQGLVTQLDFPGKVVTQSTSLILTPTLVPGGSGFAFAGHAFELSAYQEESLQPDFAFGASVTVTVHYSNDDVQVVTDESQLALWWWMGSEQQDATQTCVPPSTHGHDVANNVFSVAICRVGRFGLLGPTNQLYLPLVSRNR